MQADLEKKLKEIDSRKNDEIKPNEKPLKVDLSLEELASLLVQDKPSVKDKVTLLE